MYLWILISVLNCAHGHMETPEVTTLTDSTFAEIVTKPRDPAFVQFFAPWCGHCVRMMPMWNDMAKSLKGETIIAKIDCTENPQIQNKYNVRAFPTLKLFTNGRVFNYGGGRSEIELRAFLDKHNAYKSQQQPIPKHTLRYFNWRGEAEPIRVTLNELGIKYEDIRYDSEEHWAEEREVLTASGVVPFGVLPALSIGDQHLSMTGPILLHLARGHGLYGANKQERGMIDTLLDDCHTFIRDFTEMSHEPDHSKHLERKEAFQQTHVAAWLQYFEKALERSRGIWQQQNEMGYLVGESLSVADICVFHCVSTASGLEPKLLSTHRSLKNWFVGMGTRDNLNPYLSGTHEAPTRPEHMHGAAAKFGNKENPLHQDNNPFRHHIDL